ncbi:MAG: nuclear transport factor 2 family protein [Gammaproteobacteria bacterium]
MKAIYKLSLALTLFGAVSSAVAGTALSVPGIDENNARWQEAMNRSLDDTELKALYTRNAVVVPPSQEILGDADFTDFLNRHIRIRMDDFQIQSISLRMDGDRVYQSAVWMATIDDAGEQREIDGELTNVFLRQADGTWKIEFQNWN